MAVAQPQHTMAWVKGMLDYVLEHLPDAITKEPETELVSNMLQALREVRQPGLNVFAV